MKQFNLWKWYATKRSVPKCFKAGISLISLIITIIVIIILAAIVIFSGLNTPDRANFAKYVQSVANLKEAVQNEWQQKKTSYALSNATRTDAQIYYTIATGNEITDINNDPVSTVKVSTLNLNMQPEALKGENCYEITVDKISGFNAQTDYYEPGEKHYITDEGEVFVLPGYRVVEDGIEKWYLNERIYVLGSTVNGGDTDTPVNNNTVTLNGTIINTESKAVVLRASQEAKTRSDIQNLSETELQNCFASALSTATNWNYTWESVEYDVGEGCSVADAFDCYVAWEYLSDSYEDVYDFIVANEGYANELTFSLPGHESVHGKSAEFVVTIVGNYTITATDGDTKNGSVTIAVDATNIVNREDNQPEIFSSICVSNTALKSVSGGVAPAELGDTVVAVCPAGFAYGISSNVGTISSGLVITDAVDNGNSVGNEFVWIPVDKEMLTIASTEYEMAEYVDGHYRGVLYNDNAGTPTKIAYSENGRREPVYLEDATVGDGSEYNTVGITQESLQSDYDNMIASVKEYGGFYVGRFALGQGEGNFSKLGATFVSAVDGCTNESTGEGALRWYGLWDKSNDYVTSSVASQMIWGSQYDAILIFALTGSDSDKLTSTYHESMNGQKAGFYLESDSVCNIFDLHHHDAFTQQASDTTHRVARVGAAFQNKFATNVSPAGSYSHSYFIRFTCDAIY